MQQEEVHSWEILRDKLKERLPPHLFHSLVAGIEIGEMSQEKISLQFLDNFSREHFEKKCLPTLKDILIDSSLQEIAIELSVLPDSTQHNLSPNEISVPMGRLFDPKYCFSTFVIGTSNQFAHAACQAVAKQPGLCYNPLFILGGAGLGKTHLLRAIGYELKKGQPNLRILFLTSESFTNELIQAIRHDRMKEFREKYRTGCDVLLLDDIHFIAGKNSTQEEFFYTFNYLHESRRQIVTTSDRYPRDIEGLEARLQTRFEWGLVADVQPPDIETRIAILKNKAEGSQITLTNDVAEYIAMHITTNIRELEGSLHRLQAFASLTGGPISLELAKQTLKDLHPKIKHELTPEGVLKLVALQFGVRSVDILSGKRIRKLSLPRQICMYLLRKHLLMSYPEIGRFMGGKDHTTILHGVTKIAELQKTDPEILKYTMTIEGLIR